MMAISQSSVSSTAPTQTISIQARSAGSVTIKGVSQKTIINVDVQQFLKNVSDTYLRSMLTSAVENASRDNQSVDSQLTFGATLNSNISVLDARTETINRIVNSYSYTQFTSDVKTILASQTIALDVAANGDINISDISQYIKIELIVKQITDILTTTFSDIVTENSAMTTKDTTQSTSSGISAGWIASIIIIVVIIAALLLGLWYFYGGGQEQVSQLIAKA
ncbi:MAG: hypothetical protein WC440_03410 [Candidatus Omnitrophota bacterium]